MQLYRHIFHKQKMWYISTKIIYFITIIILFTYIHLHNFGYKKKDSNKKINYKKKQFIFLQNFSKIEMVTQRRTFNF